MENMIENNELDTELDAVLEIEEVAECIAASLQSDQ
jgi:hypothetical protein